NLETIRVDELIECLRVHEEHRVAVLLASRLQSKRRAGRLVKVSRRPILQQRPLAVLTANPEAGFLDARKDQYRLRFCSELFCEIHAGVQLLQGLLRRACEFGCLCLPLVLSKGRVRRTKQCRTRENACHPRRCHFMLLGLTSMPSPSQRWSSIAWVKGDRECARAPGEGCPRLLSANTAGRRSLGNERGPAAMSASVARRTTPTDGEPHTGKERRKASEL